MDIPKIQYDLKEGFPGYPPSNFTHQYHQRKLSTLITIAMQCSDLGGNFKAESFKPKRNYPRLAENPPKRTTLVFQVSSYKRKAAVSNNRNMNQ
jgi:hypothetical protein